MIAGTGQICAMCPPGSSCAGGGAAPVACAAGSAALAGATSCSPWCALAMAHGGCACPADLPLHECPLVSLQSSALSLPCRCSPAGTYAATAGNSHCSACSRDYYQPAAGSTACRPCPGSSFAHFPGSAVCIACFNGLPVVMADAAGVHTERTAEQPSPGGLPCRGRAFPLQSLECHLCPAPRHAQCLTPCPLPDTAPGAGFMTAVTSASSPLSSRAACGFLPFTARCTSLNGRTLAIETDATCSVSLLVLGDSGCSQATAATLVFG